MLDLMLYTQVTIAGALGTAVGVLLKKAIVRIPAHMEVNWHREARDVLALDHIEMPAAPTLKVPIVFSILVACLTGFLTAAVTWRFGTSWETLAGVGFTWALIVLAGIDYRTMFLPDQITLPLLWLGLLVALHGVFVTAPVAILGAALGYLSLWLVHWGCKLFTGIEGMGHGDFKLLAALGAWMGPVALLPILLIASLLGASGQGLLIVLGRRARGTPFPFGPCLAVGGWCWFVAGEAISQQWNVFR